MRDFYWSRKQEKRYVPHILGLTASPIMGSNLSALETLESLLDATCKSPRIQKEELLLHVKRPIMTQIHFKGDELTAEHSSPTRSMASLLAVFKGLNIHDDPEIIRLRTMDTEVSKNKLEWALKKNKTFIQVQMKSFCRRSYEIHRALGDWAADYYVSQVTSSFIQSADSKDSRFLEWEDSEKRYLANALRCVDVAPETLSLLPGEKSISDKVRVLINFLDSYNEETIGIIFVKERAMAYIIHRLLSDYPNACDQFRLETVVGMSKRPPGKRDICELSHPENQSKTLEKFRSGEINLLIATSVLEEGIDIPQCNLVICFDEPANLKSFVQCRGRARLRESKLVMLLNQTSRDRITEWTELEREMKRRYEIEERNVKKLAELEEYETEQSQRRKFEVPSTGARLDMDIAKGHLQYFCSRLSSHSYAEMRPEYIIREEENEAGGHDGCPLLSAKVILPASLDTSLRENKSRSLWHSVKNATKDASFEAYVALYHAGLVNERLLPFSFTESSKYMEKQDSIIEVREQFNPWPGVARAWEGKERLQRRVVTLEDEYGLTKCKVDMLIPVNLPDMEPILIYWDASTEWRIKIESPTNVLSSGPITDHTTTLLSLSYGHRWEVEEMRHIVLFRVEDMDISQTWLESLSLSPQDRMDESIGLLRDPQNRGHPYLFHDWLLRKPPVQSIQNLHKDYESFSEDQPFVALKKWSRRSDFLHAVAPGPGADRRSTEKYFSVLPQSLVRMDILPIAYSHFGLLVPSILHKVEVQLVVKELCATLLSGVGISNTELIRTAISTPRAREQDNYQKLEFLGDSVLKFLVSVFVASKCKRFILSHFCCFPFRGSRHEHT
jgi:ERCC4-related helicase/dsRNA-specific ribonuclease